MNAAPSSAFASAPFLLSRADAHSAPATLEGKLPAWLHGALMRTCPAVFDEGRWSAGHWFDGQCMLFAFRVGASGVTYQQRLLDSEMRRRIADGGERLASFATRAPRSIVKRIFHPTPDLTDNANVNILKIGPDLVALTETPLQVRIDERTLERLGLVDYDDDLGRLVTTAHPAYDRESGEVVNIASHFAAKAGVKVIAHHAASRARRIVGEWRTKRIPYLHSFGLTKKSVVVIGHPFDVNPLSLLWSNRAFVEHFAWRPKEPTRFAIVARDGSGTREVESEACFIFHVINAFDDGSDVVLDALVYDDASIVSALSASAIARGFPDLMPKPRRFRLRSGASRVTAEPISDLGFEFPQIDHRRASGKPYERIWGTGVRANHMGRVHALDIKSGAARSFAEEGFIFGEPIFVANPDASEEGAGVVLVVASHERDERTAFYVLEAGSLDQIARAEVPLSVPLGFHGSFVRS